MQEKYTGELLENGHLSIPKGIVNKLKIDIGSRLQVTVKVKGKTKKENILALAGLLSDLSMEDEKRFDESVKRRSLFEQRKVEA